MADERGRARARRRRRFGYVFQRRRPSGRTTWSAQWLDETPGGKRVTRHFDTEKGANEFLDDLEQQVVAKDDVTPPTVAATRRLDPVEQPPVVPTFVEYARSLCDGRLTATPAKNTRGV